MLGKTFAPFWLSIHLSSNHLYVCVCVRVFGSCTHSEIMHKFFFVLLNNLTGTVVIWHNTGGTGAVFVQQLSGLKVASKSVTQAGTKKEKLSRTFLLLLRLRTLHFNWRSASWSTFLVPAGGHRFFFFLSCTVICIDPQAWTYCGKEQHVFSEMYWQCRLAVSDLHQKCYRCLKWPRVCSASLSAINLVLCTQNLIRALLPPSDAAVSLERLLPPEPIKPELPLRQIEFHVQVFCGVLFSVCWTSTRVADLFQSDGVELQLESNQSPDRMVAAEISTERCESQECRWMFSDKLCAVKTHILKFLTSLHRVLRSAQVSVVSCRGGDGNFWFSAARWAGAFFFVFCTGREDALWPPCCSAVFFSPHTGATLWKNYQLSPHMHKVVRL